LPEVRQGNAMLSIEKKYVDEMVDQARLEAPNECCGLLAGKNERVTQLYRTANTLHSPVRYNVDPLELIRVYQELGKRGWDLLGIYHSHPHSEAYPSAVDLRYAFFPRSHYFIVGLINPAQPQVRVFRITGGKIEEEELKVIRMGL
jgi:[CysO sulfur-carrier protein]-S-L-cysteine hydrolase